MLCHAVLCPVQPPRPVSLHPLLQVRMVDARPGIAFIEFDNDMSSTTAMSGLQGFKINPEHAMVLSYAKQ